MYGKLDLLSMMKEFNDFWNDTDISLDDLVNIQHINGWIVSLDTHSVIYHARSSVTDRDCCVLITYLQTVDHGYHNEHPLNIVRM